MSILTLHTPQGFTQTGEREKNEDAVYPPLEQVSASDRLFLVCDGVGGASRGEVASRLVSERIAAYIKANPGPSDTKTILAAIRTAEESLDKYSQGEPQSGGMATTMTLLHLHDNGATVAHVGDSRVYCCRAGQILFETDDHKLVGEWVKQGILTPQQAAEHPNRNVIIRAIQGSAKPAQPDVVLLTNLQPDDYFFLCTDGVLEALTTEQLTDILGTNEPDIAKIVDIQARCDGHTQDNYSAYLIHIQSIDSLQPVQDITINSLGFGSTTDSVPAAT